MLFVRVMIVEGVDDGDAFRGSTVFSGNWLGIGGLLELCLLSKPCYRLDSYEVALQRSLQGHKA